MKKGQRIVRLVIGAAALGLAVCAHAQVGLFLASSGTATAGAPPLFSAVETVFAQVGGYGSLQGMPLNFTYTVDGSTGLGMGTYTGSGGSLTINLDYDLTTLQVDGPAESIDGTWTYAGGTGTYAGLTGEGTVAQTLLTDSGPTAQSGTVLAGVMNAVPEPKAYCVLGLGLLGLCVRRKRA